MDFRNKLGRRLLRRVAIALAAIIVLVVPVGVYAADTGLVETYASAFDCVADQATINPSTSGIYGIKATSLNESLQVLSLPGLTLYCSIAFFRPAFYLQSHMLLYKWDSTFGWILAADSGALWNFATDWAQSYYWDWPSAAPLGHGIYGSYGGGWVWNGAGAWHGSPLWSCCAASLT